MRPQIQKTRILRKEQQVRRISQVVLDHGKHLPHFAAKLMFIPLQIMLEGGETKCIL